MIGNVLLLVAAILSVTLPPPPQLMLDSVAELSQPERASSLPAVLEEGESNKALDTSVKKRTPKPPTFVRLSTSLRLLTLRRFVVAVEETVTQQLATSGSPTHDLRHDLRRVARRSRPLAHPPSPDDPPAA